MTPCFSLHQEPGIDKLVGKKAALAVVKSGAQFDRAGGGVDLVVQRGERALSPIFVVISRSIGLTFNRGPGVNSGQDGGQLILGKREDHADGLDLGYYH